MALLGALTLEDYKKTGKPELGLSSLDPNIADTLQWVQKANYMGASVSDAVVFSIGGKIYRGMGNAGNSRKKDIWEYDPATDKWTEKSDFPGTTNAGKGYFVIGNKACVVNGQSQRIANSNDYYQYMWGYDPATDVWTQKEQYPESGLNLSFSIKDKGYAGYHSNDFHEYNPLTDTWSRRTSAPSGSGRSVTAAADDRYGYALFGGTFYRYDPETDKWSQRADGPEGTIAFVWNGELYVENNNSFSKYDSDDNSWSTAIIVPRDIPLEWGVVCNGKLYVGGGLEMWEYTF